MKVYEFGDKQRPAILLLPGTCCYWRSNFGHVIEPLQKKKENRMWKTTSGSFC